MHADQRAAPLAISTPRNSSWVQEIFAIANPYGKYFLGPDIIVGVEIARAGEQAGGGEDWQSAALALCAPLSLAVLWCACPRREKNFRVAENEGSAALMTENAGRNTMRLK